MQLRGPRAFTLIELLVVTGIVGIFAAILFPVFAKAREKARAASCSSNAKQIMLAWTMYTQDYDGIIMPFSFPRPDGTQDGSSGGFAVAWPAVLQPHIKNTQIFRCPSDQHDLGYTYNAEIPRDKQAGGNRPLAAIQLVAQTPIFIDAAGINNVVASGVTYSNALAFFIVGGARSLSGRKLNDPTNPLKLPGWVSTSTGGCPNVGANEARTAPARHTDGAIYALADGHVKWFHNASTPSCTPPAPVPAPDGLDYNGDGIVGTGSAIN